MDKLDFGTPPPGKRGLQLHLEPRRKGKRTLLASRTPAYVTEGLEAKKTEILLALERVVASNSAQLPHTFEWYYQSIEKVCRFRPVELLILLGAIFLLLKGYYTLDIKPQLESAIWTTDVAIFLQAFLHWDAILRNLSKIFMYIDRTYLKQHRSKHMIYEFGILLVVDHILVTEGLRSSLIKMAAKELDLARLLVLAPENLFTDSSDCVEFFKVLVTLNYAGQLKTREIWIEYAVKAHIKIMRHIEPENYYKACEAYIKADDWFLEKVGESKAVAREFRSKVIWQWIFRDFNTLLAKIIPHLLADELFDLYELSTSAEENYGIDATQQLCHSWGQFVYNDALEELKPHVSSKEPEMIRVVTKILEKYQKNISLFKGENAMEPNFEFELRNAVTRAVNTPEISPVITLQLCRFCDLYFKLKATPGIVADENTHDIENGLAVFKLINNKMAFLVTFKREFSRRLLFNKVSPKFRFERQFIKKLSAIVGQDDYGLQGMIDEIRSRVEVQISGVDFTPVVLLSKNWPEFPKSMSENITLPEPLDRILSEYKQNYKHEQKRLDWSMYTFHQVVVQANFPKGTCELSTNLLQAAIVLLFNETEKWTVAQIATRLNICERTARAGLVSLNEKYRILVKVVKEKREVKDSGEEIYKYNQNFQDRGGQRLKVPPLKIQSEMHRAAQNEADDVQKQRNRSSEIRALLTRLCKGKPRVLFEEVVSNAFPVLEKTGVVSVGDIEAEIHWLVQQEFLLRQEEYLVYVP